MPASIRVQRGGGGSVSGTAWLWLMTGVLCLLAVGGLVLLLALTGAMSLETAILVGAVFTAVVALFLLGYLRRLT